MTQARNTAKDIAHGRMDGKGEYIGITNATIASTVALASAVTQNGISSVNIGNTASMSGIGITALCGIELAKLSKDYYSNKISWDEFGWRLCSKIAVCNAAAYVGTMAAQATGNVIATPLATVGASAGTAGIGLIVGTIGAVILGAGYGVSAEYLHDHFWPKQVSCN